MAVVARRDVFSFCLKEFSDRLLSCRAGGKLFHAVGPLVIIKLSLKPSIRPGLSPKIVTLTHFSSVFPK